MVKQEIYNLTYGELATALAQRNISTFHVDRVWQGLYRNLAHSFHDVRHLRDDVLEHLRGNYRVSVPKIVKAQRSSDGFTQKYLLALDDGREIETVIMRYTGRRDRPEDTLRFTACISTQAGCAMGCVFCATGQMGFQRHLTAGEIVGQIVFVQRELQKNGHELRNIVLMGMGEPLHNYDNTMKAIDILTDHKGLALAPRRITLSTVGLPHGIRRLADDGRPINLAVSLHGATDAERAALVPPARRWPLAELIEACRYYAAQRERRIFFEWTLIAYENDTPEQAHQLGQLLQGMAAHVNVIPLNPTDGYDGRPSDPARVKAFQAILKSYGLPSTVRQRRGIDIAAGCGQLAAGS
ncbi:MAG: 23S rRNA (adenine(2503)-C(2))-methyltransferase RlmN [Ardenticatenaceae bacterium]|nr:23S rRNA (adenine(2503)-C(2))-methyltransferase RlmN [Ardenticatenaceae bacterium]